MAEKETVIKCVDYLCSGTYILNPITLRLITIGLVIFEETKNFHNYNTITTMGKKTLKIGFAMGGGVSLGSFSGAALTETIKQLIVYGGYKDKNGNWRNFDKIEIDVFSGASAGAISLAIMLRMFYHYQDKLHLLYKTDAFSHCHNEATFLEAISNKLKTEFKNHFEELDEARRQQLISAQIVQEFQKHLWVDKADIMPMSGIFPGGQEKKLNHLGSILDRSHLQNLAQETLLFDEAPTFNSENNLLAKRVLFANTLTRIEHEQITSRDHFAKVDYNKDDEQTEKLEELYTHIIQDGTTSYSHKDIRVFDINFKKLKLTPKTKTRHPARWLKFHQGSQVNGHTSFGFGKNKTTDIPYEFRNINKNEFWASIAATAMAAGAFPLAFEQVPLKRFAFEYGEKEFNITGTSQKEHIFSYIDGGTFNNEPISEAFRLSSFIDSFDIRTPGEDYERYLIYVDPLIGSSENEIKDYYRQYKTNEQKGVTIERNGTEKMLSFIPSMINILRHQGSVIEMDKSIDVHNLFGIQKQLRQFYATTIRLGLVKEIINPQQQDGIRKEIKETIEKVKIGLQHLQARITVPSVTLAIKQEIKRLLNQKDSANYYPTIKAYRNLDIEAVPGYKDFFDKGRDPLQAKHFEEWLIALFHIGLDLGLDLTGKNEHTKLIPIGPIEVVGGNFKDVDLAGKSLSGFYGFLDVDIRHSDFESGRVCTINLLQYVQLLDQKAPKAIRKPFSFDKEKIKNNLRTVLRKRLKKEMYLHNLEDLLTFGGSGPTDSIGDRAREIIVYFGQYYVDKKIRELIDGLEKTKGIPIEFRVQIPLDKNFQLADFENSPFTKDINPQKNKISGKSKIISTVLFSKDFDSVYTRDGKIHIAREKDYVRHIPLIDQIKTMVVSIPLPSENLHQHIKSYSYPIFRLDLSKELENEATIEKFKQELKANPNKEWWTLESGIASLDDTLLDTYKKDENGNDGKPMPTV